MYNEYPSNEWNITYFEKRKTKNEKKKNGRGEVSERSNAVGCTRRTNFKRRNVVGRGVQQSYDSVLYSSASVTVVPMVPQEWFFSSIRN